MSWLDIASLTMSKSNDFSTEPLGRSWCLYLYNKIVEHKGSSKDLGIGPRVYHCKIEVFWKWYLVQYDLEPVLTVLMRGYEKKKSAREVGRVQRRLSKKWISHPLLSLPPMCSLGTSWCPHMAFGYREWRFSFECLASFTCLNSQLTQFWVCGKNEVTFH